MSGTDPKRSSISRRYAVPARMLSCGKKGSAPRPCCARRPAQVAGITCISPMAPRCDTACRSPALSARITALIQASGMLKRCDAAAISAAWIVCAATPDSGRLTSSSTAAMQGHDRDGREEASCPVRPARAPRVANGRAWKAGVVLMVRAP